MRASWFGQNDPIGIASEDLYHSSYQNLLVQCFNVELLFLQCIIFDASVSDEFGSCLFKHQAVNPRSLFVTVILIICFEPFTLIDFRISALVEYAKYLHFHPTKTQIQ